MPTARELLEQADALMRRNRAREFESDIPELTDEVAVAEPELPLVRESSRGSISTPRQRLGRGDDVPELNDAISIEEVSIQPLPDDEGEVSRWLEIDLGDASITGPAPDSIAVVPTSMLRSPPPAPRADPPLVPVAEDREGSAAAFPTAAAALAAKVSGTLSGRPAEAPPASDPGFDAMLGVAPAEAAFELELAPLPEAPPPATPAPDETRAPEPDEAPDAVAATEAAAVPGPLAATETVVTNFPDAQRWEGLAEEIRMQVLQRIDIFTDTGLHGELATRLQPIVDRASADLVSTINREVGQILRTYVAEAIEREIEKWRDANP